MDDTPDAPFPRRPVSPIPWSVAWDPARRILASHVAGVLTLDDVHAWRDALRDAGGQLPPDTSFRLLDDLRGYEVADQDRAVHQVLREVTPLFLAGHGFRVGFFTLYETEPPFGRDPGRARCVAVAHVHHDADKMARYNDLLATPHERFFETAEAALAWLEQAPEAP